jgi:hypothetical protein
VIGGRCSVVGAWWSVVGGRWSVVGDGEHRVLEMKGLADTGPAWRGRSPKPARNQAHHFL